MEDPVHSTWNCVVHLIPNGREECLTVTSLDDRSVVDRTEANFGGASIFCLLNVCILLAQVNPVVARVNGTSSPCDAARTSPSCNEYVTVLCHHLLGADGHVFDYLVHQEDLPPG